MTRPWVDPSQSVINNLLLCIVLPDINNSPPLPPSVWILPAPAGLHHLRPSRRVQGKSATPPLKKELLRSLVQRAERTNRLEHASARPRSDWHLDKMPAAGLCATRGGVNLLGFKEKLINRPPSAKGFTINRFLGQMYHLVLIRQPLLFADGISRM